MKYIIFICFTVVFCNAAFAYVPGGRIDSVRNYMATEIVYQFLKEYTASGNPNLYNDYDWDKYYSYKKIEVPLAENSLQAPMYIGDLSRLLEANGFAKTNEQFTERVKYIIVDRNQSADTIVAHLIASFAKICANIPISHIVEKIGPQLEIDALRYLKSMETENTAMTSAPIGNTSGSVGDNPIGIFWMLAVLALVVYFLSSYLMTIKFRKQKETTEKEILKLKNELRQLNESRSQTSATEDTEPLKREISRLAAENLECKNSLAAAESKLQIAGKEGPSVASAEIETLTQRVKAQQQEIEKLKKQTAKFFVPENTTFYMGHIEDGHFPNGKRINDYLPGQVLYKFVPGEKQGETEFGFISDDESLKFVRTNNMDFILPACDPENDATPNTRRVITKKLGKAQLEWRIVEKAVITFDNGPEPERSIMPKS